MTPAPASAVLATVFLVAAGCSGSPSIERPPSTPDSASSSASSLSKAQFVRRGNRICRDLQKRQGRIIDQLGLGGGRPTPAQARAFASKLAPAADLALDQLGGLDPPPEDAAKVTEILGEFQRVVERLDYAARDRDAAVAFAYAPTSWFFRLAREASEYGLTSCAF